MNPEGIQDANNRIARKTARGIVWNFLAYGLGKVVVLITTSILARILSKNDFGLIAIALVALNYLSAIKDLGLGVALIQRKGDVEEVADSVFTINLILGSLLTAIVIPLAPMIAIYFKDPAITPVLRCLGLTFILQALSSAHISRLRRDLDYRRKFIPDMGNSIVKGGVSIGLAFAGYGVWSLVFGQIAGIAASLILVWSIFPWRPRLTLKRDVAGGLIKFGAIVTGDDLINQITDNIDYIIVGRVFGLAPLSVYSLAYRLPEMLIIGNLWIIAGVILPAFSLIQDKPDELRRGFLISVRAVQLIALPICAGLLVAAEPIVLVVFGSRWLEVIPILRVLAIYTWIYSIGYHVGDVYKAIGRPDIILKLSVFTLIIILPALLLGSRFGLIGIAFGHLAAVTIRQIISLFLATRFMNVRFSGIIGQLKSALMGILLMAPVSVGVLNLTAGLGSILQLTMVVLSGAFVYVAVIWRLERDELLQMVRIMGFQM